MSKMKNAFYIILFSIAGYTIAPFLHGAVIGEFVFNPEELLFILVASPYCMVRYLLISHQFVPAWQAITTYIGFSIWIGSLLLKPSNKKLMFIKMFLAFVGGFIWNFGFHESGRYFLSA